MADEVTPVDFGKERNEYVRKLSRLLDIVERHYEDVRNDPVPFLREAHDEIVRQRRVIREAVRAYDALAFPPLRSWDEDETPRHRSIDETTIRVRRDEYEGLKALRAIIKAERDGKAENIGEADPSTDQHREDE